MEFHLEGTVALVTGAAGNIGVATVQALAREGVKVIAADLRVPEGDADHEWHSLDVSDETQWHALIDTIRSRYGRLDILVNNAGIARMDRLEDTPLETWQMTQRINVDGVFLGMKAATALMRETGKLRTGGASIINLASGAADRPSAFGAAYCTSKAAVAMLTRVAALEYATLGYPIRVNSVHPGAVASDMFSGILERYLELGGGASIEELNQAVLRGHPMGRLVEPDDVADTIVFLASGAARYTHGDALHVDGGHASM